MSSKMLAGLVAGGFGVALYIAVIVSVSFSPLLAADLALALLLGLGVFAGALSAAWLDLDDYGQQASAGALAGLMAAGIAELCDLTFRLVMVAIGKTNPTNLISNFLVSRLPTETEVALVLLLIVINLLLYLWYLVIVVSLSSMIASLLGRKKSTEALKAIVGAQEEAAVPTMSASPDGDLLDPALWPYQRPEYSPFINDAELPPPLPPWQRRRLEQEGVIANEQDPLWGAPASGFMQGAGAVENTPRRQSQRNPRVNTPTNAKPMYRMRLPAYGQRPKPRGKGR